MSFVRYLQNVISLVLVVFAGPQITVINTAGNKLTFGGGTRVLVKPSEYRGLSYSSVSNTEAGAWSSIL